MKPTQEGRYIARPIESSVGTSKEKQLPQFVCKFEFLQQQTPEGWVDISSDRMEMTGWFNLAYIKDGQNVLNEISIKQITGALGWDGISFKDLNDTDWSGAEVQLVLEWGQDKQGKDQLNIKYLNPRDYEGGMKRSTPEEVQSIESKYGAMLRASAKKNGTAPTSIPKKTSAADKAREAVGGINTKAGCWNVFKAKIAKYNEETPTDAYDANKMAETFKTILGELFGVDKDLNTLNSGEWANASTHIVKDFDPATGGLIPI